MFRSLLLLFVLLFFQCKNGHVENISIKGSDTEVNLVLQLAEAYMATDPDVSMSITGGGSGVGIAALLNGKTDIANSSREINQHELLLAQERQVMVEPFIFAVDALAVIVHPSVQVQQLTLQDLGKIYSGQVTNWNELGGSSFPISLYGRQGNSGTYIYFRDRVVGQDFSPDLKQMNGNAQILEAVKNDPGSIGYISLGFLTDHHGDLRKGFQVVSLSATHSSSPVSPLDKTSVSEGLYPLTRPLYQYTNGIPSDKIKAFYAFEKSEAGISIIRSNGYLPYAGNDMAIKGEK